MRFDLFENRVREAADNHHPAYDEFAWRKMRRLLDQHMPEKERKRRFLFFLPLILFLGGGTWLALEYSGKRINPQAENQETKRPSETIKTEKALPILQEPGSIPHPGTPDENLVMEKGETDLPYIRRSGSIDYLNISPKVTQTRETSTITSGQPQTVWGQESLYPKEERSGESVNPESLTTTALPVTTMTNTDPNLASGNKNSREPNFVDAEKVPEPSAQKKKRSPNRFFFFASVGADASFIKEMGETRLMPGVGAGFTVRDKITIRSGLFTARKVYSAKPSEYDLPPNVLAYYPNLRKIDADCDILELPLLVSYQFGRSVKKQWMATAGISSIFMKKEKYNYHFKPTPNSPEITKSYTLRNESIHHYSIATISMGYKRQLGKRVSLTAEPYLKMPLKGIGLGKVKLHSGGVMFTVGVSPFGR